MGILMNCIKFCNSHLMSISFKNKLEQGKCENQSMLPNVRAMPHISYKERRIIGTTNYWR